MAQLQISDFSADCVWKFGAKRTFLIGVFCGDKASTQLMLETLNECVYKNLSFSIWDSGRLANMTATFYGADETGNEAGPQIVLKFEHTNELAMQLKQFAISA